MLELFAVNAAVIAVMMLAVWLISLPLRDVSIIDLVWGLGFVLVAWTSFLASSAAARHWLPVVLATIWGVRLSTYLAWRNHGRPEDPRYRTMRDKYGSRFPWVSLLTVFGLQGVIMWIVSLPLQLAQSNAGTVGGFALAGTVLFALGWLFEAVGDWQLARFKADPDNRGQVMDRGLWRYTRHPNYFGDFCVWWGLYLVAVGAGAPWWTFIGPLVMSIFLMRISGVTLLEKSLKQSKPGYEAYVRRTNAFFPGLPRSADR